MVNRSQERFEAELAALPSRVGERNRRLFAIALKGRAAFWLGAIRSELLPIRSLVYSGGKSIHALLRLKEEESFASQWDTLARTLASDADPAFRCDLACRNPGRMTRFPGAVRPETGQRQTLLYLA